jgi:dephospho-CoA kinase
MFDYVVLITADQKLRMKRKAEEAGFSEEEFLKRDSNQIPDEEKKKQADFIFENNNGVKELKEKVNLLINILKGL